MEGSRLAEPQPQQSGSSRTPGVGAGGTAAIVLAFFVFAAGLILAVIGRIYERYALERLGVIGGVAGLLVFFVSLAKVTEIIRDATTLDRAASLTPYSLARTQLAYWTILTIVAYTFVWAVDGEPPLIEGSTLAILGISMGTTAGARIVDSSQQGQPRRIQDEPSEGFFSDILSDANGVSIHRFQMVAWSLVLGAVFVECAIAQHSLKQFPDEMLALLGISNGAYVGLKIPENVPKDSS